MNLISLTDLELIDKYIASPFVNPAMLGEVNKRGLYDVINLLPSTNLGHRKAVARMRYKEKKGGYVGDEEIEEISSLIKRLTDLRNDFANIDITDSKKIGEYLESMRLLNVRINSYF